jgi:hypothetical protein
MRQIRAADNKLRRLFQDVVITESREALAKAIYSIKDDFVRITGMSQRPSFTVRTQSILCDHQLLPQKSGVSFGFGNTRIAYLDR